MIKYIMNKRKLESLTKKQLMECISELCEKKILKWEQIADVLDEQMKISVSTLQVKPKSRLSQEYISENMKKAIHILDRIEEQELMMSAYWYEDYSEGYWNSTEKWEYDDTDGIADMLIPIIKLAVDCMEDCWYEEALILYDRLLDMEIYANDECDGIMIGLEELVSANLLKTDLKSICLNTLYCDY